MIASQVLADAGVSAREAEVLALLGKHRTNAEIGERLFISVRTVESHVSSLLRKLGVADRRALADLAPTLGAGPDGDDAEVPEPPPAPRFPVPLTSFVGRVAERAALADLLGQHRLVTALGPGGVGKTRLALAVAADAVDRYPAGVWFVDLVPVTDPARVGDAVAAVLGLAEQLGRSPTEMVTARLADAEALLVLDNCEHVLDGVVAFVEGLLSSCPRVDVLATSRSRLAVPFERVFTVPGLSRSDDAVALFVDRAAMAGWTPSPDDQPRIVALCDQLDGLALAIELAAARVATLGLDGLDAGLADRLGLLAGGSRPQERQRSLRATLDWSYDLLDPAEQAVWRRASVIADQFSADTAASVVDDGDFGPHGVVEALGRLADHSLLVATVETGAPTRYRMLETIRQYGESQLVAVGEHDAVRSRHLRWCLAQAAALGAPGDGEDGFAAVADDLRAALGWAAAERRPEAHELAIRLAQLTFARGLASEAQWRYEQAATLAPDDRTVAEVLRLAAAAALSRLAGDDALRLFREAAEAAGRTGDDLLAARLLVRAAELMSRVPGLLTSYPSDDEMVALIAEVRRLGGDDPAIVAALAVTGDRLAPVEVAAAEHAVELARAVGDIRLESAAYDELTVSQLALGLLPEAAASTRQRLERLENVPLDVEVAFELTDALHMGSMTAVGVGDLAATRRYARGRRHLSFHRTDDGLLVNWELVAAALAGDLDQAVMWGERFLRSWERLGRLPLHGFSRAPAAAALVAGLQGDDEARVEWLRIFDTMRTVVEAARWGTGFGPVFDGILALHRGEVAAAVDALADDPESLVTSHTAVWRQWWAAVRAEAQVLGGTDGHAEVVAAARVITAGNPIASAIVQRSAALMAGDDNALRTAAAALEAAGTRYQQARTLVLLGGAARREGEALMAELGAVPMTT